MPFLAPTHDIADPNTRFLSATYRGGGSRPQLVAVHKQTDDIDDI